MTSDIWSVCLMSKKMYFTYGAMNCGKSATLLQVAHNYEERGMHVLLAKPSIDTKGERKIVSRLGVSRDVDLLIPPDADVIGLICETMRAMARSDASCDGTDGGRYVSCVLVDEAQFLTVTQVDQLHRLAYLHDMPVMCYGIRTGFLGQGFEGSIRLLEIADELRELTTICHCGRRATMNLRLVDGRPDFTPICDQYAIDTGKDNATYESVCPRCWHAAHDEWQREHHS